VPGSEKSNAEKLGLKSKSANSRQLHNPRSRDSHGLITWRQDGSQLVHLSAGLTDF
jgi:hypothetical protein